MPQHNALRDVETKPHAASIIFFDLKKALENQLQLVGGNSQSGIVDGEA